MAEYIEREAFIAHIRKEAEGLKTEVPMDIVIEGMANEAKAFPSADVQPVRHGRWELDVLDGTPGYRPVCIVCSECHRINYGATPCCPNCGAKMDGEA